MKSQEIELENKSATDELFAETRKVLGSKSHELNLAKLA